METELIDQEEKVCPLGICDGSGITVENPGCCGGCEICGTREEREVPCPCQSQKNE